MASVQVEEEVAQLAVQVDYLSHVMLPSNFSTLTEWI